MTRRKRQRADREEELGESALGRIVRFPGAVEIVFNVRNGKLLPGTGITVLNGRDLKKKFLQQRVNRTLKSRFRRSFIFL